MIKSSMQIKVMGFHRTKQLLNIFCMPDIEYARLKAFIFKQAIIPSLLLK